MWFCLPLPYSNPHIGEEYDVHSVVVWFEYFATTEKSRFLLLSAPDVVLESLNRFEGSCQESRLHACDIIVFLLQNILKIWNSKMQLVDVFGSITVSIPTSDLSPFHLTTCLLLQTYTFHQHNNNNGVNISKTMEDLNLKLSGLGKYGANLNYFEVLIGLLKNSKKQHPSNESHRDSYLTQLNGFVAQVRMMRGFLDEIKQRTQHAKSLVGLISIYDMNAPTNQERLFIGSPLEMTIQWSPMAWRCSASLRTLKRVIRAWQNLPNRPERIQGP